MKKLFFLIFLSCGSLFSFAQWEFQYFVVRAGANFTVTVSPQDYDFKFLKTPSGDLKLYSIPMEENGYNYSWGQSADLCFHYDFSSDNGGFVIGIGYENKGTNSKYKTLYQNHTMEEWNRVHALTVPAYIKLGKEIFENQSYFFVGAQYNMIMSFTQTQKVDWTSTLKVRNIEEDEFQKNSFSFLMGFNYLFFNFELDYHPKSFFNKDYIYKNKDREDDPANFANIKPYETQPQNMFFLKTSVCVPISEWTTSKNWSLQKVWRKLQFWR